MHTVCVQSKDPPKLYAIRPVKVATVKSYADRHDFGLLNEHRVIDDWLECQVDPSDLRDMHGEFRRNGEKVLLKKGRRFAELLEQFRSKIESDEFPAATDIRTPWPSKPRIVVQKALPDQYLYVADGVKRTFNALFNGETRLDAFVVCKYENREVC